MQKIISDLKNLILNFFGPREILVGVILLGTSIISFISLTHNLTDYFKSERIVYKGEIKEGILGIPKVTNPYQSISQTEKELSALLFSPLIRNLEDSTFELALASKVEITSDKTNIKIYLEEDAKFSDEKSITSEDVIFSLQNIPLEKNFTAEKVDNKILNIKIKKDFAGNPLSILTFPILPKDEKFEGVYSKDLITSSPYKISSTDKDTNGNITKIYLKRFNNGEEKMPHLKNYSLSFFTSEDEALTALQRREIDVLAGVPGTTLSKIKSDTSFKLNSAELPNNFALFINQNTKEVLKSNKFRQILSKSIDRENLVNQVLGGYGVPERNILGQNSKATSNTELVQNLPSLLSLENGVLYTNNKTEESDKKKSSNEKSPVKISITTINNKELSDTAEFIANTWKKLGVEVSIKKIDRKELQTVVKDRDFDILLFGFSIKNNNDYYSFFSSKERNYPKLNISNYSNKKVDTYVENLQTEYNAKNISELKNSLSLELENDMPLIMLYKPLYVQAISSNHALTLPKSMQNEEDRYRFYKDWFLYTEKVLKPFSNSTFSDKLDQLLN